MSVLVRRVIAASVVALAHSFAALAQQQVISATPPSLLIASGAGRAVSFDVYYRTTPADLAATGIGFRLNFDSAKLTFAGLTNVRGEDLVAYDATPQSTAANKTGGTAAIEHLAFAYLSSAGAFAGAAQPVRLCTVTFKTTSSFSGSTRISFTPTSTAAGFTFTAADMVVTAARSRSVRSKESPQ